VLGKVARRAASEKWFADGEHMLLFYLIHLNCCAAFFVLQMTFYFVLQMTF
jgi:hypothetical protein